MPETQPNPLLRNLAIADALLTRAADDGLPLPDTAVSIPGYAGGDITLQWEHLSGLERWAVWLDVTPHERRTPSHVHVSAVATVDDTPIRLAYTAPVEDAAA